MTTVNQAVMPQPAGRMARFISYSVNLEDVILNRIFHDRPLGVFVDVGAAHPKMENDCKALYDRGWRGLNIEPNPSLHAELLRERPGDISLNLAVDEVAGEACYYEVEGTGLSTLDRAEAQRCRINGWTVIEHAVATRPLAEILAEAAFPRIDLLKVDVEGWEEHVLRSNDWKRFRPEIIMVEATMPERPTRRKTGIAPFLAAQDYRHAYFDGLNDFYVREDSDVSDDCFALPPNVFDHYESYLLGEHRELAAGQATARQALLEDREAALTRSREELTGLQAELGDVELQLRQALALRGHEQALSDERLRSLQDREIALAEARDALAGLQDELADATLRLGDFELQLRQALLERDDASRNLALRDHELASGAERNRSLEESVGRLQADCIDYADRLEATHAEYEELLELRRHRDRLTMQEASARAELAHIDTTVRARLNAQLDTQSVMAAEIEAQRRQVEMLRQLYADSQSWLTEMRGSTSWQLTRPIRAAARLLRND